MGWFLFVSSPAAQASRTTLRACGLPPPPRPSERSIITVGASGLPSLRPPACFERMRHMAAPSGGRSALAGRTRSHFTHACPTWLALPRPFCTCLHVHARAWTCTHVLGRPWRACGLVMNMASASANRQNHGTSRNALALFFRGFRGFRGCADQRSTFLTTPRASFRLPVHRGFKP